MGFATQVEDSLHLIYSLYKYRVDVLIVFKCRIRILRASREGDSAMARQKALI